MCRAGIGYTFPTAPVAMMQFLTYNMIYEVLHVYHTYPQGFELANNILSFRGK